MAEMSKLGATKKQGVLYTFDGESTYDTPEITADIISNIRDNHLIAKLFRNQENLIFRNPFTISVKSNETDEIDEQITEELLGQLEPLNPWTLAKQAWGSNFFWGPAIFNPVYAYEGTSYVLKDLRMLPAESFSNVGGTGDYILSSPILPGISLNRDGKIEYWQTQEDGNVVQLDSKSIVMHVCPLSHGIAGTPKVLPLVPLVQFYKWVWNALSQKINREGAAKPYVKLNEKTKAGDEDYAVEFLEADSKDESLPLLPSMDLVNPYLHDSDITLDTLKNAEQQIMNFFNPASMIAKDGTLIGGSSRSELDIVMQYISGEHEIIENCMETLLTPWLIGNGYTGYYIDVDIPEPEVDTSELDIKRAAVAMKTKGVVKANELRALLGLPENEDLTDVFIDGESEEAATFMDDGCCQDIEELVKKLECS